MASYQVGAVCYDTPALAVAATGAAAEGTIVAAGSFVYSVNVASTTASAINYRLTNMTTGAATPSTVEVTPQACSLTVTNPFSLTSAEGAQIAGAILAVWALGFGFRSVIRALHIDGKTNSESES